MLNILLPSHSCSRAEILHKCLEQLLMTGYSTFRMHSKACGQGFAPPAPVELCSPCRAEALAGHRLRSQGPAPIWACQPPTPRHTARHFQRCTHNCMQPKAVTFRGLSSTLSRESAAPSPGMGQSIVLTQTPTLACL